MIKYFHGEVYTHHCKGLERISIVLVTCDPGVERVSELLLIVADRAWLITNTYQMADSTCRQDEVNLMFWLANGWTRWLPALIIYMTKLLNNWIILQSRNLTYFLGQYFWNRQIYVLLWKQLIAPVASQSFCNK